MRKVYTINCSHCSAPLKLLGGGRIQTVTCSYCKSLIDLNDNYKVLSHFKNHQDKHKLPFKIGMKGILEGIEYTIIGRITYKESDIPFLEWSDFLLFSPLYGYGWLTYEEGHLSYSRRNRTFPNQEWNEIPMLSEVVVDGVTFQPFSRYSARVLYVEGELTWIAKKGDKYFFIDLIAPPFGLSVEKSKNEIEYYRSEYLDAPSVYRAFNVEEKDQVSSTTFNPLVPFNKPILKSISKVSIWFMAITIFLFMAFSFDGKGELISSFTITNSKVVTQKFKLTNNQYLTKIVLKSRRSKSLKNFNIKLYREKSLIFSFNGVDAYHFDAKTQKIDHKFSRWNRKAKSIAIYLHLKVLGDYRFVTSAVDSKLSSRLDITIQQKASFPNYLILFFTYSFVAVILYAIFYAKHQQKLQEERTIFNLEEKRLPLWIYNSLSHNIFMVVFLILILFITIYEI